MRFNTDKNLKFGAGGILIFGMPRSGTTWLGKIFDSHPLTVYKHEPDSWSRMANVSILAKIEDRDQSASSIQHYYRSIVGMRSAKVCAKTPTFPKAYLSPVEYQLLRFGILLSRVAGKLGVQFPVIGAPCRMPENGRLVWKSIESIGRLRSVLHALPAVRAIHLLRHPCGYVASVMRGETHGRFQDNRGASEDYGILKILLDSTLARQRGLTIEYFQTLTPVERLAWRWALFNDEAVHASEDSERCRSVRYEDVCADPVAVIKDIYKFVALDWSMQTEEFVLKSTTQNVSDYYSVFKDPLTAAYKWRNELDAASINRILSITRDTVPGRLFVEDL